MTNCQSVHSSLSSIYMIPYQWNLKEMNQEPKTIATKMIMFRNEKSFCVGLQNHVTEPSKSTLFFVAVNLHKMGLRVREVFYCSPKTNQTFRKMSEKNNDYDGSLQVYTSDQNKMVLDEKCTFNFLIYLDGNVSNYSHQQCDRLLKEQLWATVGSVKHFSSDVELVVNDRTFWVHKAVLAARSPVFAKEFKREDPCAEVYKLEIEEAEDPLIVEQFLHFIYTGESNHMLFNSNELRKLADRYKLPILSSLCRVADKKILDLQLARFALDFHCEHIRFPLHVTDFPLPNPPPENWNYEYSKVFSEPTLILNWKWENSPDLKVATCFKYLNESVFSAEITGNLVKRSTSNYLENPTLRFICINTQNLGFEVSQVFYSIQRLEHDCPTSWIPLQLAATSKFCSVENFICSYSAPLNTTVHPIKIFSISFCVQIINSINNYHCEMVDTTWERQLWSAAIDRQLTDVEIWIGREKFEVHRVILSARSLIFDYHIQCQIRCNGEKRKTVFVLPETYAKIAKPFFEFLYTGFLTVSPDENLLSLAKTYGVDTLIKICELATRPLPDTDTLTSVLLTL